VVRQPLPAFPARTSTEFVRLVLSLPNTCPDNRAVECRFTSECELCAELLTDYIAAANEIVETKERLHHPGEASASQLASALIDHALKRRSQARKRLFLHKDQEH